MRRLRRIGSVLPFSLGALIGLLASSPANAAQESCLRDWSEAAAVVEREGLTTVAGLTKLAEANGIGQIVQAMLCRKGDQRVYRLVVSGPDGRLVAMTVDARQPFDGPAAPERKKAAPTTLGAAALR